MKNHVATVSRRARHLGSVALTLASALVVACGSAPADAPAAADVSTKTQVAGLTELVVNGNFSSGSISPWWNGPNTQSRVENGLWRVDVAGGTANSWDAPVGQDNIPLTNGQSYTLSFTASATANVSVRATVQMGTAPYTAPLDKQIALDGTSRRFTYTFTSPVTTNQGQVTFQLGGRGAFTFRVDDISLTTGSSTGGSGPLALTSGFYVDPNSNSAVWVRNNGGDWRASSIQSEIASKPMAH